MVEPTTQDFEAYTKFGSLDVSKSFSQGMSAVVSGQIDGPTPRLHHSVDCHHGEGLAALSGLEKVVIVVRILVDQEVT